MLSKIHASFQGNPGDDVTCERFAKYRGTPWAYGVLGLGTCSVVVGGHVPEGPESDCPSTTREANIQRLKSERMIQGEVQERLGRKASALSSALRILAHVIVKGGGT